MEKLKQGDLRATDDDVRAFWEKESEVKARHILVSDRALAETLRQKIAQGESFETLAKAHSEDPYTGKQGGDLGYLLRGSLVPEFEDVLFALKTGETSPPTASPYGIHLIQRTGERRLSESPLDDALKGRIRLAIDSQKLQRWFDRARPRFSVAVDENALNDLVIPTPADTSPTAPSPAQ
jgi:peptidyl-prolyl cis-trans isomerase C